MHGAASILCLNTKPTAVLFWKEEASMCFDINNWYDSHISTFHQTLWWLSICTHALNDVNEYAAQYLVSFSLSQYAWVYWMSPWGWIKCLSIYQTVCLVEVGVQGYITYGKMCAITTSVRNKYISLQFAAFWKKKT